MLDKQRERKMPLLVNKESGTMAGVSSGPEKSEAAAKFQAGEGQLSDEERIQIELLESVLRALTPDLRASLVAFLKSAEQNLQLLEVAIARIEKADGGRIL